MIFKRPKILIFFLDYKCNCKCVMCNIWKKQTIPGKLNLSEIKNFFNQNFIKKNLRIINLTGGEPFLNEKLENVISIILSNCFKLKRIDIPTNGVETELILDKTECILSQLFTYSNVDLTITVAIDGVGITHEKIRGKKDIFKNVIKTIDGLKELESLYPYFSVNLNMVVSILNYAELEQVIDLAKNKNVFLNITPLAISDIGVESKEHGSQIRLRKRHKLKILEKLNELDYLESISSNNRKFFNSVLKDDRRGVKCVFLEGKAFLVEPNGNFYSCGNYSKFKIGNIKNTKVKKLVSKSRKPSNYKELCNKCISNCYLDEI